MKYVVYEVWTKARIIEADSYDDAVYFSEPSPYPDPHLNLSNWHVVPLEEEDDNE